MNDLTKLALHSDEQSYMEGAEDGFWRGYNEGATQMMNHLMGWMNAGNPYDKIPDDFKPMGHRYLFNFDPSKVHHEQ